MAAETQRRTRSQRSQGTPQKISLGALLPGERSTLEESTVARFARILSFLNHNSSTRQNSLRHASHLHSFISAVVDIHLVGFCREGHFFIRIEDNNVGIRTDCDCSFAREQ